MLKTFSVTDVGRRRKANQDYVYTSERSVGNLPNLFIVADGMGGHNAGDFASRMTVETMTREIAVSQEQTPARIIGEAIETSNRLILETAARAPELNGMGTTVVVATIIGNRLHVANVGDSRLYVVGREIRQITRDHSMVEEMVRMGIIDRASARTHPDKNKITRAVGAAPTVEPDFFAVDLEPDDVVLMCTDGLTNMLEDEEIRMTIREARDIVEAAQNLVAAANAAGGRDNITVLLMQL